MLLLAKPNKSAKLQPVVCLLGLQSHSRLRVSRTRVLLADVAI